MHFHGRKPLYFDDSNSTEGCCRGLNWQKTINVTGYMVWCRTIYCNMQMLTKQWLLQLQMICREWWICVISIATLWLNPAVCWQNAWLDSENSQFSQPPTSLQETHLVNWMKLICCLYRIYIGAYVTATHNTFYLHYRWLKLPVSAALSTCELVECCLQTVHRSQSSVTHLLSVHINNQSPAGIVHSCTSAQSAIN